MGNQTLPSMIVVEYIQIELRLEFLAYTHTLCRNHPSVFLAAAQTYGKMLLFLFILF